MPTTTLPPLTPGYYQPARQTYTPGLYFLESWSEIKGSETGPEEVYADAITQILLETDGLELGYAGMMKTRLPQGLTPERAEEIRSHIAFRYLDSHDYLPAFSTPADWAESIGAPVEFTAALMQDEGRSVLNQLPTLEDGTLPAFFDNAVEKLLEKMAPLNDLPDFESRMEYQTVWERFTALAIGYPNALAGLPYPQLTQMIADAVKEFAPKLQQYRLALLNKKEGAFDALLAQVKEQNLNKEDAVSYIVRSFLG